MASSRNKNSVGNYRQEMIQIEKTRTHTYYTGSVINQITSYPGEGLLGCRNPNLILSNDYTDIETELFGIGSTNLVQPRKPQIYDFKQFKVLDIQERSNIILPQPLIVSKNNRPFFP
jgi:hypothetical protein